MRTITFASRNTKEITRDILTLIFGIAFPLILLLLLSAINKAIPRGYGPTNFQIQYLAPGITVFGLSFLSLFSSMLIAKDRTTGFVLRLFTSPLRPSDFILGSTLPMIDCADSINRMLSVRAFSRFTVFGESVSRCCGEYPDLNRIHRVGSDVRLRAEREGGRRYMRRSADEPFRMVLQHLV